MQGWHGKEIDRDQLLQERAQVSDGGLWEPPCICLPGLPDIDAELQRFTVDAWCAAGGMFAAHPADQLADFVGKRGPSWLAPPNLPGPEQIKASAMPALTLSG